MLHRLWIFLLAGAAVLVEGCDRKLVAPSQPQPTPPTHTWVGLGLTNTTSQIWALAVDNTRLVAGGAIYGALGRPRLSVVQWDGSAWSAPPSQPRGDVESLAFFGGDLIAGVTDTADFVFRWDGSGWEPLGGGVSGPVVAITAYRNALVCGGLFVQAGGKVVSFVAAWDGADWKNLGPGVSNPVYALTVFRGDLVAGGRFWSAGGQPAAYIARWDGSAWHPLGTGMDGVVTTLTVHRDTLIAGGYFRTAGGVAVNGVARWDGAQWDSLGPGVLRNSGNAVFWSRATPAIWWRVARFPRTWRGGAEADGARCPDSTPASRPWRSTTAA